MSWMERLTGGFKKTADRLGDNLAGLATKAALDTATLDDIEEALIALQSTASQQQDAAVASEGFESSFRATEARFKGGLATVFELEDARRSAVAANSALIDLQRERVVAWISLYRALGGGWSAADAAPAGKAAGT